MESTCLLCGNNLIKNYPMFKVNKRISKQLCHLFCALFSKFYFFSKDLIKINFKFKLLKEQPLN